MGGRRSLGNVLRAYACHNPRVRYCQGLNFIAGLLLSVFADEEQAFWALASAIQTLGIEDYYTHGMTLLRADVQVLTSLLAEKSPKTARLLSEHEVDLLTVCSEWHITWFSTC